MSKACHALTSTALPGGTPPFKPRRELSPWRSTQDTDFSPPVIDVIELFTWDLHGASWQRGPHFQIQGIFRVLRETHFPWSVLKGKTGFRLLSSRNGQRRRRHGPKDSISIFWKKSSTFHQKSIFHRDFTVTPYRPTAALYTPNNPPYT